MTRRYLFTLTLLSLLVVAGEALAMRAELNAIGGGTTDDPINYEQCEADVAVEFEVTNNLGSKYLFVMVGSNCEENRTELVNDTCERVVGQSIEGLTTIPILVRAKELGLNCGRSEGEYAIYFLGQPSESDERLASGDWYKVPINVDTTGPPAPTGVTGGRGENSIPVKWSFSNVEVEKFWVYYDPVSECPQGSILYALSPDYTPAIDAAASESDADDAGVSEQENPWDALAAVKHDPASASSREHELQNVVGVGETAAVAVMAIDDAGNRSELSNVACIEGVATVGFCEANESMGGTCESGCSVGGGPGARPGRLPAALLLLLAAAWIRMRRKDDASIV